MARPTFNSTLAGRQSTSRFHSPSSVRYECECFYDRNVADSALPFIERESTSMEKWHYSAEARFKSKVQHLLKVVDTLKQQGLIDAWLVHTFMHHWFQPLISRQRLMYK